MNFLEPINLTNTQMANGAKINLSIQVKDLNLKKLDLDVLKQKSLMINESVDTESVRRSLEVKQVGVGSSPISNESNSIPGFFKHNA